MAPQFVRRQIFDDLLAYIHDRLGFRFTVANRDKLETKLRTMHLSGRWPDLQSYHQDLMSGSQEAHDLLVRTITVSHTYFFREIAQIEAMAALIRGRKITNPLIWCAASSTGEEVYSIVIQLLEQSIQDFRVVASDINPKVLHKMNQGIYHVGRLDHVSKYILHKYFRQVDEFYWRIDPSLRRYIAIKKINLVEPFRFAEAFDFIFCRNVFIYFDDQSRNRVLTTIHNNLRPGGYLFVGLTEALLQIPSGFVMEAHASYRRVADTRNGGDNA